MPWVNQELCESCGVCVEECPVGAIRLVDDGPAAIDEASCIRCGRCHDACPHDAVRHDGERIPREVAANLEWVRGLLDHFEEPSERAAFMDRMARFFKKQKKVTEQTLAAIQAAGADPANAISAAVRSLTPPGQAPIDSRHATGQGKS